jgi:hypothetical protein
MQGELQAIADTSAEPECGLWTVKDFVRGSSCWAAFESPADRRKQEMTPSSVRLSIFIAQQLGSLSFESRTLKTPDFMPANTLFPVVSSLLRQKHSAFAQMVCDRESA